MQQETLRVGDILDGKYVVEALIGRGGMGSVFRARHIQLDSPRAIKVMRADLADDEDFVRRFENEALLAEGVRHPNVVALYDFATLADGTRYIVWEYVEGETIRDLLDRGARFSSEEVRDLVKQIAEGLSAAHQKGVLHRDVSPDNVMVVRDEQEERVAKLLDFGLAKAVGYPASVPSDPSLIFGKIGFASPEQMGLLGDEKTIDERTDIFSLAAVAYAMLTGRSPFAESSMKAFNHDLLVAPEEEVRRRYLENLPEPWREPLSRALSRDRTKRPPTIEAFLPDVDAALGRATDEALGRVGRRSRLPSKRAFLLSATTGVLVLLTGAFVATRSVALGPMPVAPALEVPAPFVPHLARKQEISPTPRARGEPPNSVEPAPKSTSDEPGAQPIPSPARGDEGSAVPDDVPPAPVSGEPEKGVEAEPSAGPETPPDSEPEIGSETPGEPEIRSDPPRESMSEPPPENPPPVIEPRRIVYVPPVYPPIAVRSGTEGDVVLNVSVDPRGNVTALDVESSPSKLLERPAIEAVKQWKYAAMEKATTFQVTVSFQLN